MKSSIRLLGLLIGGGFLAWAVSLVDWQSFRLALTSLQPLWVALSAASLFLSMLSRSIRWHILTGLPVIAQPKVWEATCIGYLGTAIYPARIGDVMRMLRLQQLTGLGGGVAIGSGIVDRILEGLGLCCLLMVLALLLNIGMETRQGLVGIAVFFVVAALGAGIFVLCGHRLRRWFSRLAVACSWGRHIERWYEQSLAGLQVLRSPMRLMFAVAMQGVVSLFDILACWLLIHAFGWALPLTAGAMVLAYVAAASALPSSPGYVGVYQIAALFALQSYGIDNSSSVAYGTVLQALTLILFVGVGSWAFLKEKHSRPPAADITE